MTFHAIAADAPARLNLTSTFRNHLLCSVCTALLLAGSCTMALAADDAATKQATDTASSGTPTPATAEPSSAPSPSSEVAPPPKIESTAATVPAPATLPVTDGTQPDGKLAARTVVKTGETKTVRSGDAEESFTVETGGTLNAWTGDLVKDVVVNGVKAWDSATGLGGVGGVAFISDEGSRIDNATINLGGRVQVVNHATAGAVIVENGGDLDILDGALVKDLVVNGAKAWDSATGLFGVGGVADISSEGSRIDKGTVNSGGLLQVGNHATAGNVTVNNGGLLTIAAEGVADKVVINGGYASTFGQIGTAVVNVGILAVAAGGKAGDITLNGGDTADSLSYAVVDGSAGDIVINKNGRLNGAGTVGNVWVHSASAVVPGASVDKFAPLTATGNVTFDKGSFFTVRVANDGMHAGKLVVQGQANLLGGVAHLKAEDFTGKDSQGASISEHLSKEQVNNLFQKSFVILTAEKGVTGRFEKVEPNYNYITPTLAYTDETVSVGFDLTETAKTEKAQKLADELKQNDAEADRRKTQLLEERVKTLFLVNAVTPNQKSTGHAVMQLGLGNRLLQTVLFSQRGEMLNYDSLSGEAHATLRGTLLQDAALVSGAASDRVRAAFDGIAAKGAPAVTPLAYGPDAKDRKSADAAFAAAVPASLTPPAAALWGQAYGSWSHGAGDGNAAAYNRNTGGFVTGVDGVIGDTWRLGILAGYGSASLHGAGSSTSVDSYQAGLYGGTKIDALTLSLGTVLAHHAIDTRRTVSFGSLEEAETAGYSANTVQLFGEAAYRIDTAYAALEPFAAAAYTHLKTDGFSETGGIAALSAPSATSDLTTTTLGLRASRAFTLGDAASLTARGMAGWRHAYGDVTPQAQFAFAGGGESFTVSGLPIAADTALVEAGLAFDIGRATTVGLTYTGQFASGINDNSVKADLAVRF